MCAISVDAHLPARFHWQEVWPVRRKIEEKINGAVTNFSGRGQPRAASLAGNAMISLTYIHTYIHTYGYNSLNRTAKTADLDGSG
jgi:hypothetical protein